MNLHLRIGLLSVLLVGCGVMTLRAETPEEWIKLGARVHGGFGAFIPVGIHNWRGRNEAPQRAAA